MNLKQFYPNVAAKYLQLMEYPIAILEMPEEGGTSCIFAFLPDWGDSACSATGDTVEDALDSLGSRLLDMIAYYTEAGKGSKIPLPYTSRITAKRQAVQVVKQVVLDMHYVCEDALMRNIDNQNLILLNNPKLLDRFRIVDNPPSGCLVGDIVTILGYHRETEDFYWVAVDKPGRDNFSLAVQYLVSNSVLAV